MLWSHRYHTDSSWLELSQAVLRTAEMVGHFPWGAVFCSACWTQKSLKCNRLSKANYIHVQIHRIHCTNVFFLSTLNEECCPFISQGISHADAIVCQENSMDGSSVIILWIDPYLIIPMYYPSVLQVWRNRGHNHFMPIPITTKFGIAFSQIVSAQL